MSPQCSWWGWYWLQRILSSGWLITINYFLGQSLTVPAAQLVAYITTTVYLFVLGRCGSLIVHAYMNMQQRIKSFWPHQAVFILGHTYTCQFLHHNFSITFATMFWAEIEESEKASSHQKSNPRHLACAASALTLSYNNRTTTSPYNPMYVLYM